MFKNIIYFILSLMAFTLIYACAALKGQYAFPLQHPPEAELGKSKPMCTDCHAPREEHLNYERFNHTVYFADNHRHAAYQYEQVCLMCHDKSSCNDCHATNHVELKPSLKNQTDTYRRTPHRGDYISRHRIDGRLDPTSCFRCHGNPKTNQTCLPCHG